MLIAGQDVGVAVLGLATVLREPFACAATSRAAPIAVVKHKGMPFFQIGSECIKWNACRCPLVLLGSEVVGGESLPPALAASLVLPIGKDIVEVDPLDLLELPLLEGDLVLVALPLLLLDPLEILTLFAKSEDLVLR